LPYKHKRVIYYAPTAQRESPTTFTSSGKRASKLPLVALIVAKNSFP
jgi:hypothetical protein